MRFKLLLSSQLTMLALGLGIFGVLAGCATPPCCDADRLAVDANRGSPACGQPNCLSRSTPATPAVTAAPTKILAVGYGAPGNSTQYTPGQQKLMAMRAAQVDAYRNLAEQVYGFRVWGNTAISAFTTQNDNVRAYVDAQIRGARMVSMSTIADGNFEATVELEISQNFLDFVAKQVGTSTQSGAQSGLPACTAPGCSISSAHYVSN